MVGGGALGLGGVRVPVLLERERRGGSLFARDREPELGASGVQLRVRRRDDAGVEAGGLGDAAELVETRAGALGEDGELRGVGHGGEGRASAANRRRPRFARPE